MDAFDKMYERAVAHTRVNRTIPTFNPAIHNALTRAFAIADKAWDEQQYAMQDVPRGVRSFIRNIERAFAPKSVDYAAVIESQVAHTPYEFPQRVAGQDEALQLAYALAPLNERNNITSLLRQVGLKPDAPRFDYPVARYTSQAMENLEAKASIARTYAPSEDSYVRVGKIADRNQPSFESDNFTQSCDVPYGFLQQAAARGGIMKIPLGTGSHDVSAELWLPKDALEPHYKKTA
jgi:hypothetical protein